ncbi:hypothetical protein, partial [Capnocytophaga sp. oral taxon 326]|uniref:hypothetical protein n=1 Tax=Capnocytophaga sp. oral taxon 326 TaxID=712212 RepID=UPI0002A3B98B
VIHSPFKGFCAYTEGAHSNKVIKICFIVVYLSDKSDWSDEADAVFNINFGNLNLFRDLTKKVIYIDLL